MATTSGIEMLGQDLAFALARETSPISGMLTDERMADLANKYRNIIEGDSRIEFVVNRPEVEQISVDTVEAEITALCSDGERHEMVVPVQTG